MPKILTALLLLLLTGCTLAPKNTTTPPSLPPVDPATLDIQGHRGARGLRPENTLPAFETALDLDVTTLELDLHLSADDVVVVWHDPALSADKCDVEQPLPIRSHTLAELSAHRCNRNPDPARFPDQSAGPTALAGDNYAIISLVQLFDFVDAYASSPDKTAAQRAHAAGVRFNIESKRDPRDPATIGDDFDGQQPALFERAIVELIEARGLVDRVTVQSFDHRSLWAVHALNPDVELAALTARRTPVDAADFVDWAARGATVWSPDYSALTPGLLAAAHEAGLKVIPWTVDEVDAMQRLVEMGVDGIITDRPDLSQPTRNF